MMMKRRLFFYVLWSAISFCVSILALFIAAIVQAFPSYLYIIICALLVLLSSASFAVLFKDKRWVSLLKGLLTGLCSIFLLIN